MHLVGANDAKSLRLNCITVIIYYNTSGTCGKQYNRIEVVGMFLSYKTVKVQEFLKIIKIDTMYFNIPKETKMVARLVSVMIWMRAGFHLDRKSTILMEAS
jgi:hypothetical protein